MNGPVHRFTGAFAAVAVAVGLGKVGGNILTSELLGHNIYPLIGALTAGTAATLPDYDMKIANGRLHRGPTHSLVALALVGYIYVSFSAALTTGVFSSILLSLMFGVFVGYASHIYADLHNGKGVALFWPLPFKVHVMQISTGTWQEFAWAGGMVVVALSQVIIGGHI